MLLEDRAVRSRKKSSFLEDVFDVSAMLPWWAGTLLAMAAYLLLRWVAMPSVIAFDLQAQGPILLAANIVRTVAAVGQYVLPAALLAGAALSAWHRHQRKRLLAGVARDRSADPLGPIGWLEFERLVGEAFRRDGYRVVETGGAGADGGFDLVLVKGGEKHLVQCKHWRAFKVGVRVVRELYGVMAATGAAGGFVVTSGRFTAQAERFAVGCKVTLIDGPKLRKLIRQAGHTD